MENLVKIQKALHEINFAKDTGILFPLTDQTTAENYQFTDLKLNEKTKKREHSFDLDSCPYCTKCDEISPVLQDENDTKLKSRFTNITHGTHTLDFLKAHKDHEDISSWSTKPVMFVMDNPGSYDSGIYNYNDTVKNNLLADGKKWPSKWWYWINGQDTNNYTNEDFKYPNWFQQKEYGWMIYSVINTFQIANAYVTNMVKCGACNKEKTYVTTDRYNTKIVEKCISTHLVREINALRGVNCEQCVTIFAFGQNVYDTLTQYENKFGNVRIYLLPHPANRLANDYRKYVLLGKILRGLLQTNFYENVTMPDFYEILKRDEETNKSSILTKKLLQTDLEDYLSKQNKADIEFKQSSNYKDKQITYQIREDDASGLQVIFRYSSDNNDNYKVSWACYYPETSEIQLYRGKNKKAKSSQLFVDDNHEDYIVYQELRQFAEYFINNYLRQYTNIEKKQIQVIKELPSK